MWMAFLGIGGVLLLIALACKLIVVVHAFKNEGAMWGILSLVCTPADLFYAFTKFSHPKKGLILAAWIICGAIGGGLMGNATAFAPNAVEQLPDDGFGEEDEDFDF